MGHTSINITGDLNEDIFNAKNVKDNGESESVF